jgi:hypothetical protein
MHFTYCTRVPVRYLVSFDLNVWCWWVGSYLSGVWWLTVIPIRFLFYMDVWLRVPRTSISCAVGIWVKGVV